MRLTTCQTRKAYICKMEKLLNFFTSASFKSATRPPLNIAAETIDKFILELLKAVWRTAPG